jgi:hopanoid biosynthesis associated protein HpnK
MRTLIVTADDFGLSLPVNEAIEQAHQHGILTAASLMTGAPAFDDAVERAKRLPRLGVGLHLTLVDGCPVLPPTEVPGLVGPDGRFSTNPVKFGTALYFSADLRRQAEAEITAQFEKFRASGLSMDHVNGHQHFHMHPVVAKIVTKLAATFAWPPIRLPIEPLFASYGATPERFFSRLGSQVFYTAQARPLCRHAKCAGLPTNDYVFGLNDTGAMTETRVLNLLDNLPDGISEMYFHPATARWAGIDNLPSHYLPVEEYAALTSVRAKARVKAAEVRLVTYRDAFKQRVAAA